MGLKFDNPVTLAIGFYSRLYYHASRDASTDGGATTPALHCWPPSIRCAGSDNLEIFA